MAGHLHAAWLMSAALLLGGSGGLAAGVPAAAASVAGQGRTGRAPGNTVVGWGDDSIGELGIGSLQEKTSPVTVPGISGVTAISAGDRFTLALLAGGTVMAWGDNTFGQLGDGSTLYSARPVRVRGLSGVTAVAAGGGHALALLANGTVMAWGDNEYGQLGSGTTAASDVPEPVPGLTGVTGIAAGAMHSMALLAGGTVVDWGDNSSGQLGDGNLRDSSVPVAVRGLTGVTQVSAGQQFSVALQTGGTAKAWGYNTFGQLGNGQQTASDRPVKVSDLTGAVQISSGWTSTLALLPGGQVDGWGDNPEFIPEPEPVSGATVVADGGQFKLALMANGTVTAWGDNALGQLGAGRSYPDTSSGPVTVLHLTGATAIAAGASHAVALAAPAAPPGPRPAGSAQPSIWQDVPSPNPGAPEPPKLANTEFTDVSAATSSDAWAVGQRLVGLTTYAVAAHWNGTAWTAATLPAVKGMSSLSAVLDLAPGDAWAVGMGTSHHSLAEHWNGTAWTIMPSPDPVRGRNSQDELQAVAGTAPGNIWVFGLEGNGTGGGLFYAHLVHGKWTVYQGPGGPLDFTGATAITASNIWAVGNNASFDTTFAIHWNGKSWTQVSTPQLGSGPYVQNHVTGISAGGPDDIWASGYQINDNPGNLYTPYLLHYTASGWTLVTVPTLGGEGSYLTGVSVRSATDVWAVGQTLDVDGSILTLTEQYNGTAWSIRPSINPGSLGPLDQSDLTSVATSGTSDVLAVGYQNQLGQCCGITLSLATSKG